MVKIMVGFEQGEKKKPNGAWNQYGEFRVMRVERGPQVSDGKFMKNELVSTLRIRL